MSNWRSPKSFQSDQLHLESAGSPQEKDRSHLDAPRADRSSTAFFDSTLPRDSGAGSTGFCPPQRPPVKGQMLKRVPGGKFEKRILCPSPHSGK